MEKREKAYSWFKNLRDQFCYKFVQIEKDYARKNNIESVPSFQQKTWQRPGGGGGVISLLKGHVFEKVGVNISKVYGEFSSEFRHKIPGAAEDPRFFATGISLVAHMCSPLVPAMHFNTRYIETTKGWFGGGGDLTPIYSDKDETKLFHQALQSACDLHNATYYRQFKQQCDDYFYLKHRQEARGVGGIFYDYLEGDFEKNLAFAQDIGRAILKIYPEIIAKKIYIPWSAAQRQEQLVKRGRYVEFNLLYDRGTKFGLATGGNVEAILMSLPPEVKWL